MSLRQSVLGSNNHKAALGGRGSVMDESGRVSFTRRSSGDGTSPTSAQVRPIKGFVRRLCM